MGVRVEQLELVVDIDGNACLNHSLKDDLSGC